MRNARRRLRAMLLVGAAALAAVIAIALSEGHVFRSLEQGSVDTRFRVRGSDGPARNIVVVGVDEQTFADLQQRWPFPRRHHAQAIDRLRAGGAHVVDQVLAKTDEDLRLDGERRTVTILFSDIRGFTTFSETRTPDEVIKILNRYLTIMTGAVLANGGTLVSYIGDGIMALFGAPIEQADHADRAVATARQMAGPCLDEFNDWMEERGVGQRFRIGVGLNSGPVMVGNVGSERRLEYTAIGGVTNTASPLEGMTKWTPNMIFVSETTQAALHHGGGLVHVDDMPVRGRSKPVGVWTVGEPSREPA